MTRFEFRKPVESRLRIWAQMGAAVGKKERVASLSRRFEDDLAKSRCAILQTASRPRVAFINMTGDYWAIIGSNYYEAYTIEAAGGVNVAAASWISDMENIEQLILYDPDILLFTSNTSDKNIMRKVLAQPAFRALRAVRENRAYQFPQHAYMNEMAENRIMLTWLMELFYPDVMPRNLRKVFKDTYMEIYNYEISDDEIDKVIYMENNKGAVAYDRFSAQRGSEQNP